MPRKRLFPEIAGYLLWHHTIRLDCAVVPHVGLKRCFAYICFRSDLNLSVASVENVIYDSYCMRKFMGLDFITESVPDATTLLKFRHLLEKHGIGKIIVEDINKALDEAGLIMHISV